MRSIPWYACSSDAISCACAAFFFYINFQSIHVHGFHRHEEAIPTCDVLISYLNRAFESSAASSLVSQTQAQRQHQRYFSNPTQAALQHLNVSPQLEAMSKAHFLKAGVLVQLAQACDSDDAVKEQRQFALSEYTEALVLQPANSQALCERGALYLQMQDEEAAMMNLCAAIEVDKTCQRALALRAQLYSDQGEYADAALDFTGDIFHAIYLKSSLSPHTLHRCTNTESQRRCDSP